MILRYGVTLVICLLTAVSASADDFGWVAIESDRDADRLAAIVGQAYARQDNKFLVRVSPESHDMVTASGLTFDVLFQADSEDELFLMIPPDRPSLPSTRLDRLGSVYDIGAGTKIMSLSPSVARSLSDGGEFSTVKLADVKVRISYKPPTASGQIAGDGSFPTDELADLVSLDSLYSFVNRLEAFQTRYVLTDSIDAARDWAVQKFLEFGYTDVSTPAFDWSGTIQHNVMAVKPGYAEPDKVIVVGAHYDSIVKVATPGRMIFAPGADDNGSGSATVLELARVLADVPLRKTVVFMLFSAEEVGLIGSRAAARQFVADGVDVEVMYNYDMVGHMTDGEFGVDVVAGSNFWYRLMTMAAAARITPLKVNPVPIATGSSDHASFVSEGFDVVYSIESDFHYDGWHTNFDLIDSLHFGFMSEVVRMGLASLAIAANAGHPTTVTQLIDQGDGTSIEVFWNECDPSYSYELRYGPLPGNYTDSTTIISPQDCSQLVTGLSEGQTYFFSVVGTPDDGYPAVWAGEGSLQPLIEPRKPVELEARPALRAIVLDWADNPEADLAGYRVYRGEAGSASELIVEGISQSMFIDTLVTGATTYAYRVTAVDHTDYESELSDAVSALAGTFDQGVLLVDEITRGSIEPIQSAQESWFDLLFKDTPYALKTVDVIPDALSLVNAAPYSSLFWVDDDIAGKYISKSDETLRWYSSYDVNLFVAGYRTLSFWSTPAVPEEHLLKTDFGVRSFRENPAEDFAGATGAGGWPAVVAIGSTLFDYIPAVAILEPDNSAQIIYTFDSFTDSPEFEGKPCGILQDTDHGKRIVLGFPLLYLDSISAQSLVQYALSVFGEQVQLVQAGDVNADSQMNLSDLMWIVGYLFGSDPNPSPLGVADVDGSCRVDLVDIAYFADFLFRNGTPPRLGCAR